MNERTSAARRVFRLSQRPAADPDLPILIEARKEYQKLRAAPNEFGHGVTLSRDERQLYFSLVTTEVDIWLMTLE